MWSLERSRKLVIFTNSSKKKTTCKYSLDTIEEDVAKLETKVGEKCPEDRKSELISSVKSSVEPDTESVLLISFPKGTVVPEELLKCNDSEEATTILRLGVEIKKKIDELAKRSLLSELVQDKEAQLTIQYEQQLKNIIASYEIDITKLKNDNIKLSTNTVSFQSIIDSQKERIQNGFKQESDIMKEHMKVQYQTQIDILQAHIEEVKKDKIRLIEQLDAMKVTRNNSSLLGIEGQNLLENIIPSVFTEARFANLGSHCGDLNMEYKNLNIMWESKNHLKEIAKRDVDKFLRDMHSNPEFDIGIMIGFNCNIPAHNGNGGFEFQFLNDIQSKPYRCVFYISKLNSNPNPHSVIALLKVFIDYISRNLGDPSKVTYIYEKCKKLLINVDNQVKLWMKRKREMEDDMKERSLFLDVLRKDVIEILSVEKST